jgi:hypothetical protein
MTDEEEKKVKEADEQLKSFMEKKQKFFEKNRHKKNE